MPPSEDLISSLHRDGINCTNTVSIKTSCLALQTRKQELEYRINEIMKITLAVFKFNLKCHFQTGNEMTTSAFALELWVWCIMPPFPASQNQRVAPLYWGIFKPSENKQTKPLYTSPDGLWALHTHTSPSCRTETLFLNAPCDNEGPHVLKLRAVFTTPDLILMLSALPMITRDTFPFHFQKSEQNGRDVKVVYQSHYNSLKK